MAFHHLLKSNRECDTPGEGIMLLPLRKHRRETSIRQSIHPSPYRFNEADLSDLFTEAIHFKEHTARYRRDVSNNEKAHNAYEARKQADRFALENLRMKGGAAEQKAIEQAAALHAASPGKKEKQIESEDVSDSDQSDQPLKIEKEIVPDKKKKRRGLKKNKKKNNGDSKNEEEIDNEENEAAATANVEDNETESNSDAPTRTWLEETVVKMSVKEAEAVVSGTFIEVFKNEAINGKKLRILSPFDQKRYWADLQNQALEHLIDAIRSNDAQMVNAILTHLGSIGVKKQKEVIEIEMTQKEEEVLNKYKPPTPRKEAPLSNLTLLFQKLGPLLDVNQFLHEGLTPLHVAAGVGNVPICKILVDAWGADLNASQFEYSVFQHALNSVSKGLTDEKALDWLQIKGANVAMNPNSKISRYTKEFVDIKILADQEKENSKLEAKKAKDRARKKSRRKKASK